MFDFLCGKKTGGNEIDGIAKRFEVVKKIFSTEIINKERKNEIDRYIDEYGYIPYSQIKAINELTPSEVIYALEKKLEKNKTYKEGTFIVKDDKISAVKRAGYNNSDWIKKEQHDIKLVCISALADGAKDSSPAKFIDWLRQIVILPAGNTDKGILSTTMYLIPFQPRDFGNAYLSAGSEEISKNLEDKLLSDNGISLKEQVKLFISLTQLAGHPVIYDVFPQTGRFSKTVILNPELARWIDVKFLTDEIAKSLNFVAIKLSKEFDEDDVTIVKNIYKTTLKSGSIDLTPEFKPIYERFRDELEEKKKELSAFMTKKEEQKKLVKRVKEVVAKVQGVSFSKLKKETDITKRGEIVSALIDEGLWTLPDGAWCSSGIPVFQKMSECGSYPVFRHYNAKGHDVTKLADSDCQTPYYFVYLENGEFNNFAINYYLKYLEKLRSEYNFDGFRMTHSDFVVDEMSEKNLRPISYRIPRMVLTKVNELLKSKVPYFAVMAEYRLWNAFYKEYHQNMKFDILWGNDTKTDYEKNPSEIINNNRELQEYNTSVYNNGFLSILKTYNNQDGEFRTVNRYLGLADENEAIFKWFKFKFLPGGRYANRPCMYVDGDESFSKDGIETAIREEVALIREDNEDFYCRFDAIRRFALNSELTSEGEAQVISMDKKGFISWMVSKESVKESFVIVANYLPTEEKILKQNPDGIMEYVTKQNYPVKNKKIELPSDFELVSEYVYEPQKKDFVEHYIKGNLKSIEIEKAEPSEFRIFKIKR